jgi:hypothetical protein
VVRGNKRAAWFALGVSLAASACEEEPKPVPIYGAPWTPEGGAAGRGNPVGDGLPGGAGNVGGSGNRGGQASSGASGAGGSGASADAGDELADAAVQPDAADPDAGDAAP